MPRLKIEKKPSTVLVMHAAANVLFGAVPHALVLRKFRSDLAIETAFVGMQSALARHVAHDDLAHILSGRTINVERAGLTATLDQGDHCTLLRTFAMVLVRTATALR
jgi:hypothetical protein